jgi:hypothetical protein
MRKLIAPLALLIALLLWAGPAAAITNGEPDNGRHPYVGLIVFDVNNAQGNPVPSHRCSGALLTPTVVLTAGHCTLDTVRARVWFDENVQTNSEYPFSGATSYDGEAFTHPDFCNPCAGGLPGFALNDIGVVVLSEPVPTSAVNEYGSLPSEGVVDTLRNKSAVDITGYGVNVRQVGGGPPVWGGPRVRLFADSRLVSGNFTHAEFVIKLKQNKGGTCFGDSGGPDLIAGTDTVIAVNSYVTNGNCAGTAYSSRVDLGDTLDWIEGFLDGGQPPS